MKQVRHKRTNIIQLQLYEASRVVVDWWLSGSGGAEGIGVWGVIDQRVQSLHLGRQKNSGDGEW